MAIHRVQELSQEARFQQPLHLPPSKLYFGHFKGLTAARMRCLREAPHDLSHIGNLKQETTLVKDYSIASVAAAVRACCDNKSCAVPC